jgi:hypothetical protein
MMTAAGTLVQAKMTQISDEKPKGKIGPPRDSGGERV